MDKIRKTLDLDPDIVKESTKKAKKAGISFTRLVEVALKNIGSVKINID